ncbi:xylulokinase [Solicola gregarius]|uniref:Xylulose kinase n=1 Tax=Solicola gregarius TaxID=2908642 RepID=A0AA46THD8_9ACTN|nr:xylulokinase [Solicola gregarius]UYM04862.1 xylulokinase [Solicola gregarius]
MPDEEFVVGIDSSTQSTKAVLVRADDGTVVATRTAAHPDGTEVDPRTWIEALDEAAGPLLDQAQAVAVGGQQHGMVTLDADGLPVRDALLWNDTRSAAAAEALVDELGGAQACADATGSVFVASYTITKLRWLRDHEPDNADRVDRVLLPHDYLTWYLAGHPGEATTDRGDASGTGYYSPHDDAWLPELAVGALGHDFTRPRIARPAEVVGRRAGAVIAPGTGDNMAAALALDSRPGDVTVSIGTSGVASAVVDKPVADGSGMVSGFADATGRFLPLACTLNAARILDLAARTLGVDHAALSELALSAPAGAHGVTFLPYLDGERTPNRPDAVGTMHGLTSETTPADIARASVEGLLCILADAIDALVAATGVEPRRALLVGGGARSAAVRALAPAILGVPVVVPADGEYVALGAARQAAWALSGASRPPDWGVDMGEPHDAEPQPDIRAAYARLRDRTASWS